jgi:diguanylate cyclase (GGDEF)-like protein
VAVLGRGETVGELSLLDGSVASAHVVSAEPTTLLEIDEGPFWALINDSHAFAVNLLTKLADRLRANNAAVSKNVQQRQRYERAAMFDGLTGIHNRRWLDETLHRLHARFQPPEGKLAVGLIDIDHFKQFNDKHGHDAGDHVLTLVANTLAKNLRPTDLCARFGGEEFVLLFPGTDVDTAAIAAERLRAVVQALDPTMLSGAALPRVTISIGLAQLHAGQTVPDLLKTADQAMYQAKQTGRNRVVVGREPIKSGA